MPRSTRLMAGVMSGTSLDGIDVALVRLTGSGRHLEWETIHLSQLPFGEELRDRLFQTARARTVSVDAFVRLHARLGFAYADAVLTCLKEAGLTASRLDAVGCHGQTVRHLPHPVLMDGERVAATSQLGSGPVLANRLGVTAVTDFRSADVALGGQGAPLVPYVDWVLFAKSGAVTAALNIGGIANLSILPGDDPHAVYAFDTGPGNMVVDSLTKRFFSLPFDSEGAIAAGGTVQAGLLEALLRHPYFSKRPPKSTGREDFGEDYTARLLAMPECKDLASADLVATLSELTAVSIANPLRDSDASVVHVSGGGVHNAYLMGALGRLLPEVEIVSTAASGIDPDGKEAIAFAVLAHETLNRVPVSLPRVTGASRPAILGSVSHPA